MMKMPGLYRTGTTNRWLLLASTREPMAHCRRLAGDTPIVSSTKLAHPWQFSGGGLECTAETADDRIGDYPRWQQGQPSAGAGQYQAGRGAPAISLGRSGGPAP